MSNIFSFRDLGFKLKNSQPKNNIFALPGVYKLLKIKSPPPPPSVFAPFSDIGEKKEK